MPNDRTAPPHFTPQILIVDDSGPFRHALRELLEARGYVVTGEACTAWEAIAAVEAREPDAALVDVRLPDANGDALAVYLAQNHPGVAVVLMSADPPTDPDALLAWTAAQGFVLKSELARTDLASFWPWLSRA
jgi:DNA-binding NarL/FixJ family response regulator